MTAPPSRVPSVIRHSSVRTVWIGGFAATYWLVSGIYMLHFGAGWHLDLRVYRAAGRLLFHGGNPYTATFTSVHLPFTYPPFALLVTSPLALGPLGLIETLWWLVSALSLIGVIAMVISASPGAAMARPQILAVAAALAGVASLVLEPVRSNFDYGQINLMLMLLVVVDLLRRGDGWWRGLPIGVAAAIKLTPLVYLLFFLARRDWRSLARGLGAFAALTAVSWIALPSESARYWLHEAFVASRTGPVGSVSNQSFFGMLHRTPFHGGAFVLPLWAALGALALAAGYVVARRSLLAKEPPVAVMALALVELLVSPVSWTHHWSWLAVAPVVIAAVWRRGSALAGALALTVTMGIVAPYWWVRGPLSGVSDDALVICGVLVLIVMLTSRPDEVIDDPSRRLVPVATS